MTQPANSEDLRPGLFGMTFRQLATEIFAVTAGAKAIVQLAPNFLTDELDYVEVERQQTFPNGGKEPMRIDVRASKSMPEAVARWA